MDYQPFWKKVLIHFEWTNDKNARSKIISLQLFWDLQTCTWFHTQCQLTKSECMPSLISKHHQTIAPLTCPSTQSKQSGANSTPALLKPSHYFLLWNGAGFLRMLLCVTPWVGIIMRSKLGGCAVELYLHRNTLSGRTPGAKIHPAHNWGWASMSQRDKRSSEVNMVGCSC